MSDRESFLGMALSGKGCLYWTHSHPTVVGSWGLIFTDRIRWEGVVDVIGACCDWYAGPDDKWVVVPVGGCVGYGSFVGPFSGWLVFGDYEEAWMLGACCDYHWSERTGLHIGLSGGLWFENEMDGCFEVNVHHNPFFEIYWLGA